MKLAHQQVFAKQAIQQQNFYGNDECIKSERAGLVAVEDVWRRDDKACSHQSWMTSRKPSLVPYLDPSKGKKRKRGREEKKKRMKHGRAEHQSV